VWTALDEGKNSRPTGLTELRGYLPSSNKTAKMFHSSRLFLITWAILATAPHWTKVNLLSKQFIRPRKNLVPHQRNGSKYHVSVSPCDACNVFPFWWELSTCVAPQRCFHEGQRTSRCCDCRPRSLFPCYARVFLRESLSSRFRKARERSLSDSWSLASRVASCAQRPCDALTHLAVKFGRSPAIYTADKRFEQAVLTVRRRIVNQGRIAALDSPLHTPNAGQCWKLWSRLRKL